MSDAATAAGVPKKKLSRDLDRKVIDLPKTGKGNHRSLVLPTIYHLAIGYALIKVFVPPTKAMDLAKKFFESQRGRKPGTLFESGRTWLLISNGASSITRQEIDEDISTHLQEATIAIDLSKIISNVNKRLLS
jgi:hypothetical protein